MRRPTGLASHLFPIRFILIGALLLSSQASCFGSNPATSDSLTELSRKRANKAALLSAVLPGAGQVYNHKYWKVPILAAGAGTLIYLIRFNNGYYQDYKGAYIARADDDPTTSDDYPNLTLDDLRVRKDYYRRNRDLCYILCGGLYILNIVDAYVDAQLKGFDVSDDITMKISPSFDQNPSGGLSAGLKLKFRLSHP